MRYKNILFDLDGTLMESHYGITNAVRESLLQFNIIENDMAKLISFVGPPLYDSYKSIYGIEGEEYIKALDTFHIYYRTKGIYEAKAYAGLEDSLCRLKNQGYRLFVATSKPEPEARRVVEHFGLQAYFDFVGGSDGDHGTSRDSKAAVIRYVLEENGILAEESIMIGDRKHDIIGAKKNAMMSVGVLYGYGDYEELELAGADYILNTTKDIADFFTDRAMG